MAKKKKSNLFSVWFHQVNQAAFVVRAEDQETAIERATTKWRQEYAHPSVAMVEEFRKQEAT